MRLQPATEADHPEVVALTHLAFRGTGPRASWNVESIIAGDRINLALLREDLAAKPGAHLLTWRDDDGELQGHVWLEPAEAGAWYLGLLTVRPDRQDQKLGRTLLAAAEDFARAHGAARMRMTVINLRDTLIAWYQRRGYRATGEIRPFPYGDDRFGRPRRDDLAFVVLERAL
ncbi:GNAT family N-acetyltransferase [Phenylobacterium hankyongense]|uniref:GNAT family N-acetyltransferase n=1 Tax=Phenylobacterium hankyongense TaxID=1813876 RepID=A0A328B746_9CAUL|nr:GNAT family N-acetyltransferase [Phenylobacterium hankyongense]